MIQDGKSIRIMRKTFNITAGIQLGNTHMKLTIKNTHLEYADSFKGSPLPCFSEGSWHLPQTLALGANVCNRYEAPYYYLILPGFSNFVSSVGFEINQGKYFFLFQVLGPEKSQVPKQGNPKCFFRMKPFVTKHFCTTSRTPNMDTSSIGAVCLQM